MKKCNHIIGHYDGTYTMLFQTDDLEDLNAEELNGYSTIKFKFCPECGKKLDWEAILVNYKLGKI